MRQRLTILTVAISLAGCQILRAPARSYQPERLCGAGQETVEPGSDLARWPYLQSVTPNSATIAWGTHDPAAGKLVFGPIGDPAASEVTAPTRFTVPVEGHSVAIKAVTLTGLQPGRAYCYAVYNADGQGAGGLLFRTAPAGTDVAVRFLVVGDFGIGSRAQERIRDQMLLQPADLVLTTGDNAYMDGSFDQFEEKVFGVYRRLMLQTPVFPTPGNHDYRTERARPYLTNFFLPENAALPADRERYYSFDWGPVHFVAVDTEAPLREAGQTPENMLTWLERDLAGSNRPWTVVYLHRPAYSTSVLRGGEALVREKISPLLEKYKVALVFAGHNHVYERFHPIRNGVATPLNQGGVVYVTTGGGGAPPYQLRSDPLLAKGSIAHHFLDVQADACEFGYRAINEQGVVIDRFAMRQCK